MRSSAALSPKSLGFVLELFRACEARKKLSDKTKSATTTTSTLANLRIIGRAAGLFYLVPSNSSDRTGAMALVKKQDEDSMVIKPENVAPAIDTSDWPLLLKNWEKRTSHML